jgi:hypothetical protein
MQVTANQFAGGIETFEPLHLAGPAGGNPFCEAIIGFDVSIGSFGGDEGDSCEIESVLPDQLFDPFAICASNYHLAAMIDL